MDRIEKFVRKLGRDRAIIVRATLARIHVNDLTGLDVTKLKGEEAKYRVRVGPIRIQFIRTSVGNIVTKVGFKGDTTYR